MAEHIAAGLNLTQSTNTREDESVNFEIPQKISSFPESRSWIIPDS